MNNNIIATPLAPMSSPLELDYYQVKAICMDLFGQKATYYSLWHMYKFVNSCEGFSVCNVNNDSIKVKLFPHSLLGYAKDWVIKWHKDNSWSNLKSTFITKFGDPKVIACCKGTVLPFK
jgi:hypothetical protein